MSLTLLISLIILAIALIATPFILLASRRKRSASGDSYEDSGDDTQQQVYIGNLAYRVAERDLRRIFARYGAIRTLRIVKDRESGRSKGFGFITYETSKQAQDALESNGFAMYGRNIVVRLAKPR